MSPFSRTIKNLQPSRPVKSLTVADILHSECSFSDTSFFVLQLKIKKNAKEKY